MRCKNNFKNDRTCDICKLVNSNEYEECKNHYDEKVKLRQRLFKIEENCPYRKIAWDEYQSFYECTKNGIKASRYADECNVCLECEKYIK